MSSIQMSEADVAEEPIGQWKVEIPDAAITAWDQWDVLAYDLTVDELLRLGDVVQWRQLEDHKRVLGGDFIDSNRRKVGEAVAHLVALARCSE